MISILLVLAFAACNKQQSQSQPATDNTSAQANQMATSASPMQNQSASNTASQPNAMQQQAAAPPPAPPPPPPPPPPIVVPAGTSLVVRMGNTIDTKSANAGDTFTGTLARSVAVGDDIAIPAGASVTGTVVESKSPGKFKGEGDLVVSLTSIDVNGIPTTIQTSNYTQTVKGKGKRSAVMTGGGAGGGALIGGLAGGGKGALIGGLLGAGAGAAGSAFTGNKDLQIPAESAVTFKLANSITVKRSGKKKSHAADQDQGAASQ
ncbi:MAG TPA: hypothetical protein VMD98_01200 [Bryocella sp.]|nr:hypothetical protein [Bryocella sp.]